MKTALHTDSISRGGGPHYSGLHIPLEDEFQSVSLNIAIVGVDFYKLAPSEKSVLG